MIDVLREKTNLVVVVPDGQRSAIGKSLTLSRPLRVTESRSERGYKFVAHDGAPADSIGLAESLFQDLDMFVSGINAGLNAGYQSMLTSGTIGATIEAALRGYPAIAISVNGNPDEWISTALNERDYSKICDIAADVIIKCLERGMPEGTDILSINFPSSVTSDSQIVATEPSRALLCRKVASRKDPFGRLYYWYENIRSQTSSGTDLHEVLSNGNVSITPIRVNMSGDSLLDATRNFIRHLT